MVRRSFPAAGFDVNIAFSALFRKGAGCKYMVYPEPHLAFKGIHAVIPPAKAPVGLRMQPEAVLEAECKEGLKGSPLRGTEQHLSFPLGRVIDIFRGRRNIEVPKDHHVR